jgi:hypothetical protein
MTGAKRRRRDALITLAQQQALQRAHAERMRPDVKIVGIELTDNRPFALRAVAPQSSSFDAGRDAARADYMRASRDYARPIGCKTCPPLRESDLRTKRATERMADTEYARGYREELAYQRERKQDEKLSWQCVDEVKPHESKVSTGTYVKQVGQEYVTRPSKRKKSAVDREIEAPLVVLEGVL